MVDSGLTPFEVARPLADGEIVLRGEIDGEGHPLVLLHGLSATRRNVVQGSRHLARRGYRLISYDARGHGESDPAPAPSDYEYADLVADLAHVLDELDVERPLLAGSSMGAATAMAFALAHPDRVPALVQITPAYAGEPRSDGAQPGAYDALAAALERGGIDAFLDAAEPPDLPEEWREMARKATRQRMERHRDLDAVAAALRVVPHSRAWEGMEPLERLDVPTLVVASRDPADEIHPYAIARQYAERLPNARFVVEDEGKSPLAWQGGQLSREIERFLEHALAAG